MDPITDPHPLGNKNKHLSNSAILKLLLAKFNHDVIQLITQCHAATILDVGCGEGFTTNKIAQALPQAIITGLDPDSRKLKYAKSYNQTDNITYQTGNTYNLEAMAGKYDLVVCTEVLEHLRDYDTAIDNLKASSSKNVLITVPNEPWFRLGNLARLKYLPQFGNVPGHVNHWSKRNFGQLVSQKLHIIELKSSTFWTLVLSQTSTTK